MTFSSLGSIPMLINWPRSKVDLPRGRRPTAATDFERF